MLVSCSDLLVLSKCRGRKREPEGRKREPEAESAADELNELKFEAVDEIAESEAEVCVCKFRPPPLREGETKGLSSVTSPFSPVFSSCAGGLETVSMPEGAPKLDNTACVATAVCSTGAPVVGKEPSGCTEGGTTVLMLNT